MQERVRLLLIFQDLGDKRALGFADRPLDRVQTISTIGYVRGADIFASRQEILCLERNQGRKRNLKWSCLLPGASNLLVSVNIYRVKTDANRVLKKSGP